MSKLVSTLKEKQLSNFKTILKIIYNSTRNGGNKDGILATNVFWCN